MNHPILVTGATGYVGGRLWRLLEANGRQVRCLARRQTELASRVGEATEVVWGDVLEADSLGPALAGGESAYYLVHSSPWMTCSPTWSPRWTCRSRRAGCSRSAEPTV